MALIDNLISYWTLDEASGNRADSHGSNTLTDNNTVLSGTGIVNNAADFEASNSEYLSNASPTGLGLTTDFSISVWVNAESNGAERGIVSKWSSTATDRSYYLNVRSDNKIVVSINSNATATLSAECLTDNAIITSTGVWYHIVAMMDISASSGSIYINGSAVAATSSGTGTAIETGNGSFRIGDVQDNNLYWDGLIDEVGVWSRLLTAGEVSQLYASGQGNQYPFRTPVLAGDTSGVPTEAFSSLFMSTVSDTAGAPTESARAKFGYSSLNKSSSSWTNRPKT